MGGSLHDEPGSLLLNVDRGNGRRLKMAQSIPEKYGSIDGAYLLIAGISILLTLFLFTQSSKRIEFLSQFGLNQIGYIGVFSVISLLSFKIHSYLHHPWLFLFWHVSYFTWLYSYLTIERTRNVTLMFAVINLLISLGDLICCRRERNGKLIWLMVLWSCYTLYLTMNYELIYPLQVP